MIKAILFDLDNTLIDFRTFKIETAKAASKEMIRLGLNATESELYSLIFSVYEQKGMEYQKTFYEVLKNFDLEINKAEKIQQAAILAYLKKKFEILRPYPKVKETLRKISSSGISLGIVTDAPRNKAWQRLVICGLENEFDFVISFEDTNEKKPNHQPFNFALKKLGLLAPSCLYVGDNIERDIVGAKNIGMLTCLAKYGTIGKRVSESADYSISNFEELLKLV